LNLRLRLPLNTAQFVYGQFNSSGVTINGQGQVYVADNGNHRIQKFDAAGNLLTLWGSQGSGNGQFSTPSYVAVDHRGRVYVTDFDNHRLQIFNGNGDFIATWSTWLPTGEHFFSLSSVATDYSGKIFVVDYGSNRVLGFQNPYPSANAPVPELLLLTE
jgi:DNA-binding beta-propeller fold protein YncE